MAAVVTHTLVCSENDSDPETFNGTSFCDCVAKVFDTMKTEYGWDEDPVAVLECLLEISSSPEWHDEPGPGETIALAAQAMSNTMDTVKIKYTMHCVVAED
jgi:hypothetical protein